mmetsp:Transcript_39545/g.93075  ORF Transcript_39545/g.93075 Transcript_39545/m.93075 type:complete len:1227 (+) Transcript_39545:71-3751(+)
MGVQGLWDAASPAGQRVDLSALENKIIAVDASIWLYHFLKAMRDDNGNMIRGAHLIGFFRRICKLLFLKIKPVFVFDGKPPLLKCRTLRLRAEQRHSEERNRRRAIEKLLRNQLKLHIMAAAGEVRAEGLEPDLDPDGELSAPRADTGGVNSQSQELSGHDGPEAMDVDSADSGDCEEAVPGANVPLPGSRRWYRQQMGVPEEFRGFMAKRRGVAEVKLPSLPSEPLRDILQVPRRRTTGRMREPDEWKGYVMPGGGTVRVPLDGPVRLEEFEALSPKTKYSLLQRAQESWFGESRLKAVEAKDDMGTFCNVQLEMFLRHVRTNKELEKVKRDMAQDVVRSNIEGEVMEGDVYTPPSFLNRVGAGGSSSSTAPAPAEDAAPPPQSDSKREAPAGNRRRRGRNSRQIDGVLLAQLPALDTSGVEDILMGDSAAPDAATDGIKEEEKPLSSVTRSSQRQVASPVRVADLLGELDEGTTEVKGSPALKQQLVKQEARVEIWNPKITVDVKREVVEAADQLMSVEHEASPGEAYVADGESDLDSVHWEEIGTSTAGSKQGMAPDSQQETLTGQNLAPSSPLARQEAAEAYHSSCHASAEVQELLASSSTTDAVDQPESLNASDEPHLLTLDQSSEPEGQASLTAPSISSGGQTGAIQHSGNVAGQVAGVAGGDAEEELLSSCGIHPVQGSTASGKADGNSSNSPAPQNPAPPKPALHRQKSPPQGGATASAEAVAAAAAASKPAPPPPRGAAVELGEDREALDQTWCTTHFQYRWRCKQDGVECECNPKAHAGQSGAASSTSAGALRGRARSGASRAEEGGVADLNEEDLEELEFQRMEAELEDEREELKAKVRQAKRGVDTPTPEMQADVERLLEAFGIPVVHAPAEAEAQCVFLAEARLVDAVATDDSDALVFGAREVFRRLFSEDQRVECYSCDRIQARLGLQQMEMAILAMLLGCDYTVGVHGIGIVNGLEVVRAFAPAVRKSARGAEPVDNRQEGRQWVEELKKFQAWAQNVAEWDGDADGVEPEDPKAVASFKRVHKNFRTQWSFPTDFPSLEVLEAFLFPEVDRNTEPFSWAGVDEGRVVSLLLEATQGSEGRAGGGPDALSEDKIRERLDPALRRYCDTLRQPRITEYMRPVSAGDVAVVRSDRMREALRGLRGEESPDRSASPKPAKRRGRKRNDGDGAKTSSGSVAAKKAPKRQKSAPSETKAWDLKSSEGQATVLDEVL